MKNKKLYQSLEIYLQTFVYFKLLVFTKTCAKTITVIEPINLKMEVEESFLRPNETQEQFYKRCTNLSFFDCSEEEMLRLVMGPQRLPLQEIVPISVVLVVIFLTGVAGNAAVCVVIVRQPAMHTATNYYLFSLALSDLLLLLFGEY